MKMQSTKYGMLLHLAIGYVLSVAGGLVALKYISSITALIAFLCLVFFYSGFRQGLIVDTRSINNPVLASIILAILLFITFPANLITALPNTGTERQMTILCFSLINASIFFTPGWAVALSRNQKLNDSANKDDLFFPSWRKIITAVIAGTIPVLLVALISARFEVAHQYLLLTLIPGPFITGYIIGRDSREWELNNAIIAAAIGAVFTSDLYITFFDRNFYHLTIRVIIIVMAMQVLFTFAGCMNGMKSRYDSSIEE
ncbi:MAG: hypothetical protein LWX56_03400 [Ignavibacteria bacterium]|nr:hypothetical protein [Ignavibacteria bacterium]